MQVLPSISFIMSTREGTKRTRGDYNGDKTSKRQRGADPASEKLWISHQFAQDYVELASQMMLAPLTEQLQTAEGSRLDHVSTLKFLKSQNRKPAVIETWSPLEIALFESAIAESGKEFHLIQKQVETKSTQEVIDFYYIWKKTSHYKSWKAEFHQDAEESDDEAPSSKQSK